MSNNIHHSWTPERRAEVAQLWKDGLSAKQIATELGKPHVTRNAIIGIISRSGNIGKGARLPGQHEPKRRMTNPKKRRKVSWGVKAVGVILPPEPIVPLATSLPEPVSLGLELTALQPHQCKWPEGDRPFVFCGAPAEGAYCAYHHARAYVPIDPRRKRIRVWA